MATEQPFRAFNHLSKAYYGKSALEADYSHRKIVDEINFGHYFDKCGTAGEMSVRWIILTNNKPAPRIECFDDAWHLLPGFADLFARLATVTEPTPDQFAAILLQCGFKDQTQTEPPKR